VKVVDPKLAWNARAVSKYEYIPIERYINEKIHREIYMTETEGQTYKKVRK
jgi:hypothetical protein